MATFYSSFRSPFFLRVYSSASVMNNCSNRFRTFFSNSHRSSVLRFQSQSTGIPAVRWNSTGTSIAKKEMSSRKKFGLVVGGMIVAIPGIWYSAASNQDRRKAKVTVQGVGRFIRYVNVIFFLYYSLPYS